MKKLDEHERDLLGSWILRDEAVEGDEVCKRIRWLTNEVLTKITFSREYGSWETLYLDPNDGRYWELTYPQSEMHGGGPPRLTSISLEEAKKKYDF